MRGSAARVARSSSIARATFSSAENAARPGASSKSSSAGCEARQARPQSVELVGFGEGGVVARLAQRLVQCVGLVEGAGVGDSPAVPLADHDSNADALALRGGEGCLDLAVVGAGFGLAFVHDEGLDVFARSFAHAATRVAMSRSSAMTVRLRRRCRR